MFVGFFDGPPLVSAISPDHCVRSAARRALCKAHGAYDLELRFTESLSLVSRYIAGRRYQLCAFIAPLQILYRPPGVCPALERLDARRHHELENSYTL